MAANDFALALNDSNGDPRVICVVLADVSGSMLGGPITQLEKGYEAFCSYMTGPGLAGKRAEIAVITFASSASVLVPLREGRTLEPVKFPEAYGSTNMAEAINIAIQGIQVRKQDYKDAGLEYFRPWLVVLTDGEPDACGFAEAVERLNELERRRGVTVFPIGVGDLVNWEKLALLSKVRSPAPLPAVKFAEFFEWLSDSMVAVSQSGTQRPDDPAEDEDDAGTMVQLRPISGWTTA